MMTEWRAVADGAARRARRSLRAAMKPLAGAVLLILWAAALSAQPVITGLTPNFIGAGQGPDQLITVTGTGFADGAVVVFGSADLATSFIGATSLTATIPASALGSPGAVAVTVRNPAPGNEVSNALAFTIVGIPTLASLSPNTITAAGAGFTLTLTGANFISASVVEFDGQTLTPASWSASELTVNVPAERIASAGVKNVLVRNPGVDASNLLTFEVTPPPPLTIVTASPLTPATAGAVYSATIEATGGNGGPYHWSLTGANSLPAGLSLSDDGVISWKPTEAGLFSFNAQVTDGSSTPVAKEFSLTVAPVISSLNPSNIRAGAPGQSLEIIGLGFVPARTSVNFGSTRFDETSIGVSGSDPATAVLSLPASAFTTPGAVSVTVSVNGATSAPKIFTIIGDTTITITSDPELGSHTAGLAFSADLEATGGNGSYTWSVAAGNTLPPWLSLGATTGVLSGTPTAGGDFNFTINVVDDANPGQASGQKSFHLGVREFTVSTASLPQARVGIAYSAPLALTGGPTAPAADYQWTLVSGDGSLPGGISFDPASGTFSGTPAAISSPSQNFTVRVSARHVPTGLVTPVQTLQLVVGGGGLAFSASSLPLAVANQPYGPTESGVSILPVNGTPPYRFEVNGTQAAALAAAGLSVAVVNDDAAGTWATSISGTPTITGSFPIEVTLRDSGNTQVSQTFTVRVLANALSIQPETLPAANINTPDSRQLSVSGLSADEPTVTWALAANVAGLSLNSSGRLAWTFASTGSRTFTVQASTVLREVTRTYTIVVGGPRPVITTTSLPAATAGQSYDQTITATGGTPGYTWQLTSGSLPNDLKFDTATTPGAVHIVGVPAPAASSRTFTLTVRDSLGQTDSREFTITVTSAPIPAIALDNFTDAGPSQQKDVVVRLAQRYPLELKGVATLSFTPNATVNTDDPKVLFLNGARTASFTIPANSTLAVFDDVATQRVQTGTTAGTIRVEVAIPGGGRSASQEFAIARGVPFLEDNLGVQTNAGGFTLVATGYSTPRDLVSARVIFTPTPGTNLQTTELTIPLATSAQAWFESSDGRGAGSAFKLTIPFTVQGGTNAVASVTLTLTNSEGASNSRARVF